MKEKIIIVFVAVLLGLFATTAVFYIYESSKKLPGQEAKKIETAPPGTAQQKNQNLFLNIDEPKDESVVAKRSIQIKGSTNPGNTVIISSPSDDSVIQPASDGKFSTTITIDADINRISARSISTSGEETKQEFIVTYSTEDF